MKENEIIDDAKKLISVHFSDMTEMLDIVQNPDQYFGQARMAQARQNNKYVFDINCNEVDKSASWYGVQGRTTKQMIELSVIGDHELYSDVKKMSDQIQTSISLDDNFNIVPVKRRKRVYGDFGNEIDIHRVNQGKFESAWQKTITEKIDQEHNLICLLIDIGANCNISARDMLWTSAATLKICEIFEAAGKNVKIIVGSGATGATHSNYNMTVTCCVKEYNYHLNPERLAAMSHVGFFRSACFICMCLSSHRVQSNLGRHRDLCDLVPLQLQDEVNSGKTKIVNLRRAISLSDAISSIKKAEKDLLANS